MTKRNHLRVNLPRTHAYVYSKMTRVCPFCNTSVRREGLRKNKNIIIPIQLATCTRCNKQFVTYAFYRANRDKIICQNPEEVNKIESEIKAKQAEAERIRIIKENETRQNNRAIAERIVSVLREFSLAAADDFNRVWKNNTFDFSSVIAAFIVQKNRRQYNVVFVSKEDKINPHLNRSSVYSVVSCQEWIGKKLLTSQLADFDFYSIADNLYEIKKAIILNETSYSAILNAQGGSFARYWNPKLAKNKASSENSFAVNQLSNNVTPIVFVYFRLTNSCVRRNHTIETVTAKTINAKNEQPTEINVFFCKICNKYFINYEALQGYFSKGIYPSLHYAFEHVDSIKLKEASELMLYGYNVREGQLTQIERQNILKWIIDSGLMSKADIIRDLQFKVRYNGSKAGNERAKAKWQDDIQFVSHYVENNSKSINATFILKK